jgi:phage protein D
MWSNVTADRVVADIAKKHSFSYKAVPHPRVYEQITQAGKTDWELITSLAKQCGYSIIATNASLSFEPITARFSEKQANAHYFVMTDLSTKHTSMYSFVPIVGEAVPFEDAQKATIAISGVNPKNKTSHAHRGAKQSNYTRRKSSQPAFTSYNTSVVAPSFEASKYETEAAVERNRHPYRGTAVVLGTPGIRPGDPVYLDGVGNSYSGFWTVLKVEHEVKNNIEFVTTLHVGTDSLGMSDKWQGATPVTAPNEKRVRILGPENAGRNSIPKTYLASSGRGDKKNQTEHFSLASGGKSAKTTATTYKWESTPVSLTKTAAKEKTMPWVVRAKKSGRSV